MPLVPLDGNNNIPYPDASRWTFRDLLRNGRVVPILSNRAIFDCLFGGYQSFLDSFASYVHYEKNQPYGHVTLVKYHKHQRRAEPMSDQDIKCDFLNYAKNYFHRLACNELRHPASLAAIDPDEAVAQIDNVSASRFANLLGFPRFTGLDGPLRALADQSFKMILTTSPFTFVEDALFKVGKKPRTEVCRWTKELQDTIPTAIDRNYIPTVEEPLVYHLLGLDEYVDSLVLTEDDYLDYLGNLCQGQGNESTDFVPPLVRQAFSYDLIILGFSLESWAFRVIYAGLIKRSPKQKDRGVCEIQLPATENERSLLEDYVRREAKFQVFWGTLEEYIQKELRGV